MLFLLLRRVKLSSPPCRFTGRALSSQKVHQSTYGGVVAIHIDLQRHDINQCTAHGDFFSGTNRCQPETTKCIPIPGRGFSVGAYKCQCKKGYYFPNITANVSYFDGLEMERVYFSDLQKNKNSSFSEEFQCLPCKRGCDQCVDDSPCLVEYDFRLMRGIPLGIQSFCMTIVLIIGIVIIRIRKKKAIKVSMWIMLEIILFGALLMYTSVVVQYFEPTTLTCILVPWFREVGFAIVFGALILKIYRFLAEFQTRRARRVHIRDKDLLKYLLGLVIIVLGYMCAWTAANFQHEHDGSSLTEMGMIAEGTQFVVCKSHWWDYIIEVAEFLFLCCGIYLCYCIRSAPSLFAETRYISWAIYNETVISAILHVARHFLLTILHPDYMFLMYFLRCHLTVSVTLVLVFGPKLWYTHRPPKTDFRGRAFSDVDEITKLRMGLTLNGEVTDMNIAEMDPEEIKGELKRLYTQLQIFKTKSMRKDNPHISKRRGGRKPTHRRFSLQPFAHHHKHSRHRDHEHEYEMSRTPEESTNSAEGITIIVEDTTNGEHDEAQSTSHQAQCLQKESSPGPTVTFKPGTKRC
ncbi:probable G-protein coupled receptor 158 [Lingula anatina]|uniref:Probable G-protein coupled receptor 158 n=1 Tax=Lingula anatina TaxID=7574 RepID=A0A1S3KHW0_LINAN|nr:probable G-protein coupled receptor 158 [Lingula anatina]|eukprot:XP_013422082.1 probable G-protein coupled receptor 158 [Lingula anatina]